MCPLPLGGLRDGPQVRIPASSNLAVAERCRPLTSRLGFIATAVADHQEILPILNGLSGHENHIALSSIKIDALSEELLEILARQGEKSLAIAPRGKPAVPASHEQEGLRRDAPEKVRLIARAGFTNLKLYLQVGLPGETEEDVDGIVRMVETSCRDARGRAQARAARDARPERERLHSEASHAVRDRGPGGPRRAARR